MSMMAPEQGQAQMAAMLQQLGGGGGGDPSQQPSAQMDQGNPQDPLQAVQQVVQDMHALVAILPDPAHTQMATQAMGIVLKIQQDIMQKGQQAQGSSY